MASWHTTYPRPQLRRDSFLPLWEGWTLNEKPIRMPFPPQSPLSGFDGPVPETLLYETSFTLPEGFLPMAYRLMLHFGAVDQVADVFVNDRPAMHHEGGYLPFSGDITELLRPGENRLTLVAVDTLDHDYPYGKQRIKRGGMWYTPVSGVWQTVWLEAVPARHVEKIAIVPDQTGIALTVQTGAARVEAIVHDGEEEIARCTFVPAEGACRIGIPEDKICLWTPETPHLYGLIVTAGEDRVESYFALRTIGVERDEKGVPRVRLNGAPILMNGVLDQGYFPDGIYLPEDPDEYERDVLRMKALGFNMLRKHIKVEPAAFYHACDRLGMLVVQDLVNNGGYNYLLDTVLPTIGLQRRPNWPVSRRRKAIFTAHAVDTIRHLFDYPCIVAYTIFNEGWGQFDGDKLYRICRETDPTRLYDTASGWFIPRESDFDSRHVYFRNRKLTGGKRPLFLSECGGYARRVEGHLWNPAGNYGYGKTETEQQLTAAIARMYEEMVIPAIPGGLCGVVYTQLSDVEDEVNGLYTYDRQICKVEAETMRTVMEKAAAALKSCT